MAWANILGHDRWIDAFRAVKSRSRLAHAYLFVGPEGVGKRLFAIELAKAMLCENPPESPTLTACDQCPACLLVDAGTHPDLFQIRKPDDANVLDIDTVRELCASFGLKAARGRGKVAIVDDADDLNEQAANSFLKTLEEPPPGSIFILIGTALELQLQTIRSRCQPIRFAPLPSPLVKQILERDPEIDRGLIPRLVRLGQGSPGQARQLADPALWEFLNKLLPAIARPRFNSVELGKEFAKFAEDAGKETALHRARARLVMKLLLASIRDAIRLRLGEAPPAELADEAKLLEALAARAEPDKWLAVVERCLESEVQLDRYIPVGLVLVGLMDALGQLLDRSGS
jgi:DNA polymerase-3 subunit delta'